MTVRKIERLILALALGVCCVTGLGVKIAFATPQDINGRWQCYGNNTSGVLAINQDSNNLISGMIFGDQIKGRYIPSVRRLVFVRLRNGIPFQLYEAHVSSDGLRLAGSLIVWNGGGGPGGVDFNFSAERPPIPPPPTAQLTIRKTGDGRGTVTSTNRAGIDCGQDCTESYVVGTTVVLEARPNDGSDFIAWGEGCRNSPPNNRFLTSVDMTTDIICEAHFSPEPR